MLKFKSLETSGIEYIQLIQVCIEKECPHPGLADKSCDHSGKRSTQTITSAGRYLNKLFISSEYPFVTPNTVKSARRQPSERIATESG